MTDPHTTRDTRSRKLLIYSLPALAVGLFLGVLSNSFLPVPVNPDNPDRPDTSRRIIQPMGKPEPAIRRALDKLAASSAQLSADDKRLGKLRRSEDAAAHAGEIQALEIKRRESQATITRIWNDLGALLEIPTPPPQPDSLVRFPSEPVELHNYNQVYHPLEGPQPKKMPSGFSFLFDRVIPQDDGSLLYRVNETAGGGIKWEKEKKRARTQGHYTVEVTIDRMHPGVVYAPLWLYSEGSIERKHEYDFEIVDGQLEYNLHNGQGGYHMRRVKKDLAGHRVRYEIIRRPDHVTMRATSLTDGWHDELVITPEKVALWAQEAGAPAGLHMPANSVPMFPMAEVWRCREHRWCGSWTPLPEGEDIHIITHGYRVDP